jgi:hypothetical protein
VLADTAAVVHGDGHVHVFSKAENAVAYLPDFEDWAAYDLSGRRLALTGGWHRSWRLGPAELRAEHGRRLEPVDGEPPKPEAVRALLAAEGDQGEAAAPQALNELAAAWVQRNGWND